MNLIKPPYLKEGNTVAIIAPAGIVEYEEILKAKISLRVLGLRLNWASICLILSDICLELMKNV